MNNAENFASVEVTRKNALEDAKYELVERGEHRDFEKPDKPDAASEKRTADSLSSLPPDDLRNVGILMLLCTAPFSVD